MLCPPSREDRITVTRSGHSPKPCPQFGTLSSCASTWLRFAPNVPTTAAFYCTIEDPRVAALDLETIEGAHFRSNVVGRGSQLVSRWGAEDELRRMGGTGPARLVEELAGLVEGNHGRFGRPRVWVHAQRA
jgi:hypothetical protein